MADVLADALITTVANPRAGARRVIGWELTFSQVGLMVLTAAFIHMLVMSLLSLVLPPDLLLPEGVDPEAMAEGSRSVFGIIIQSFVGFVLVSLLVFWIGRAFGGHGRLPDVAGAMAWVSLLEPGFWAALLISLALPSPLREVVALGVSVWVLWIFASIVAEVHGFKSPARVGLATFGLTLGFGLVLSIILASAGFQAPGAP